MKLARLLAVAAVSVAALSFGHAGAGAVASAAAAPALKADNFRLTSADLQSYELYPMVDAKAVVIVTQANGDAAVRQAAPALKALKAAYAAKGVEFMMLNSSRSDERAAILAEAAQYDFAMPVLMDASQLVGEQLNVTRSGEVLVLDPKSWRVAYRGPVGSATQNWAADAVDAVIAGRAVATPARLVRGLTIAFPERGRAAQHARISYAQNIAPLIEQKCVICHEEGGIGPMQLTSYEKIKGMAPMIREVLRTKRMPPFHADTTVTHFLDDQSLTTDQIATLAHWIEAGAPRGAGADPLAGKTHVAAEWPMGKPDVILNVPAYTIPANGVVDYQRPTTPYPVTEGRWLRAATFKVDQRQAVHHILTGYIANPRPGATTASESTWGATLGTYAVGTEWQPAPADVGTYLPAGGAIGFQNHYTPFGREVVAASNIGLYYYDTPPKYIMRTQVIVDPTITIPACVERHVENAYLHFPKEALLYGTFIHAHYRGAGSKLEIRYPDGRTELLISVPRYDFNWQRDYRFANPVRVPAGSKLIATYVYDNSGRNPANPDARRTVPWGEQSSDEMLYTALSYRWMDETLEKPSQNDRLLLESRMIGMLDSNLDNKVMPVELGGQIGGLVKMMFPMLDRNGDGGLDAAEVAAVAAQFGGFSELPGG